MNKIQHIKLLELRGITQLKGDTIADAVLHSGGKATDVEMVEVNEQAMSYYIEKFVKQEEIIKTIIEKNKRLQKRDDWLKCLEAAGIDNWEGYDIAQDIREQRQNAKGKYAALPTI